VKLDYIKLTNFRQYYDTQTIKFARGDKDRVTVIHGVNGAGKTSIFLALNWCLYGRTAEGVKVIDNVGELISKEAIHRAALGVEVTASVELVFHHDGYRYLMRRSLQGKKLAEGICEVTEPEALTMQKTESGGNTSRVNNPVGLMNSVLPVNVREYFLFDGEKIDNFARPESSPEVRKAIELVLRLVLLERGKRHLDEAAKEYRKELRATTSGELQALLLKDEKARADKAQKEQRITELDSEVASARRKIAEIDEKLRNSGGAKILQAQRDSLNAQLSRRHGELQRILNEMRDAATNGYFVLAEPAITKSLALLEEKRQRGEIPSSIRQQFIQDLLDRMECLCGRGFEEGSPPHQKLISLLETSVPGSLEDDVLNTSSELRALLQRIPDRRAELDRLMRDRMTNLEAIEALDAEIDDIGRQLKGLPMEDIAALEKQRETFQQDVDSYMLQTVELKAHVTQLTETISRLEKEIENAKKAVKLNLILAKKMELAQKAADAMNEIHNAFAQAERIKVETKTREIFQQLAWKGSGHFSDIRLGPDFNLEVIDRWGQPARPELSAGERQVLSLSFITAMSRVSEGEAPLVMDTPFGRLSSAHRAAITEHLPNLADQLILFVTDEELRDEARANLEPRIGAEYKLSFNPNTSCTIIQEVL
jgi:DNA sulfur modification protein DndD